ncbi:MAG: hypothetical protein ABIB12_00515 [Patescibacteria group bacterium]
MEFQDLFGQLSTTAFSLAAEKESEVTIRIAHPDPSEAGVFGTLTLIPERGSVREFKQPGRKDVLGRARITDIKFPEGARQVIAEGIVIFSLNTLTHIGIIDPIPG